MKSLGLRLLFRGTGEQAVGEELTPEQQAFIHTNAFPALDGTVDTNTLEKFVDTMWNLCLWEQQRTTTIDTKAAALTGLSGLAAAVVSASAVFTSSPTQPSALLLASRGLSIVLFILTVVLSLRVQFVFKFGGFYDAEVFAALNAHRAPVGTPTFKDTDPHRCFLRETVLQRWLIYRKHSDANDLKGERLAVAQRAGIIAVVSLLGAVVAAWF